MANAAPAGWHTVTPRLVVMDTAGQVAFLRQAFGAEGDYHDERPTELGIGDSVVMASGAGVRQAMRCFFYIYIEDADAACERALAAGASSLEAPLDTPYGDRRAMVEDPFGNTWQIATMTTAR
jgi:PhnB protein